jgi:hypothetical protein
LYADAAIVERALQIRFKDEHSEFVVIEPLAPETIGRDEIPGPRIFNALAQRTSGPLGFLGHGARVEFRNLRVKELKLAAAE